MATLVLVLGWIKEHWPKISLASAILLLCVVVKQCGEIKAYRESSPATASASANQGQAGALSSSARVTVRYVQVPGKCPDILLDASAQGLATGSQSQGVSATAQGGTNLGLRSPQNGLWIGGAWVGGPYGLVGFSSGNGRIDLMGNTAGAYGISAGYMVLDW